MDWKETAKALFFIRHFGINDIANAVNKRRETVSRYINKCEGYNAEMEFRKKLSEDRRKEYKRDWDRVNRTGRLHDISAASLKLEHIQAVRILSRERIF